MLTINQNTKIMKLKLQNSIVLAIFMAIGLGLKAQELTPEFEFTLYFEDAAGNRDSVILGYGPGASSQVDADYGEINIIDQEWDSLFDVRITDEYFAKYYAQTTGDETFHLKRQIVDIEGYHSPSLIDIKTSFLPLALSWDSTLFLNNSKIEGSFFSMYINWGDMGPGVFYLSRMSSFEIFPASDYTHNGEPLYQLFFSFADKSAFKIGVENIETDKYNIYPNPFTDSFQIEGIENHSIKELNVFDSFGRLQKTVLNENRIGLPNAASGVYFVSLLFEKEGLLSEKKLKIFKL